MTLDTVTIPAADLDQAVRTITDGLVDHEVVPAEDWDRAVTTLARAHDQVGGRARRLVYQVFAATLPDVPMGEITEPLLALGNRLGEAHGTRPRPSRSGVWTAPVVPRR